MSTNGSKRSRECYQLRSVESSILKEFTIYLIIPLGILFFISHVRTVLLERGVFPTENASVKLKVNHESTQQQGIFLNTVTQSNDTSKKSNREEKSKSDDLAPNSSIDTRIENLRVERKSDPNDMYKTLALAEALHQRDLMIHDGGSVHEESLFTHNKAIQLILQQLEKLKNSNQLDSIRKESYNDERFLPNSSKSLNGLLLGAYCSRGKQYYMADMFEEAVQSYDAALEIDTNYLEALQNRASALLVLGKYKEAGLDFKKVLQIDHGMTIPEAFTGMARILRATNDGGWDMLVEMIDALIPNLENKIISLQRNDSTESKQIQVSITAILKRMHWAKFAFYESNDNLDTEKAWYHLSSGNRYKMSLLPPYNFDIEQQKIDAIKNIFTKSFWPEHVGSKSSAPIFIVGFPRSGSTLLERILDAHPQVAGMGEDSLFNGNLGNIRDAIVRAVSTGSLEVMNKVVSEKANEVEHLIKKRWMMKNHKGTKNESYNFEGTNQKHIAERQVPKHFVDKMLGNAMNVGFIHLLFPKAVILHVAREPLDTLFSAYKHDFPASGLYTYSSDFVSLAHMYRGYRDIMHHWDQVLPGRVTHVKYEDMVHDMPGMADAIISEIGLPWDDGVLNFHKKKHAVNTMSSTQVRKGVYKDSLQSWRKYENHLELFAKSLGTYGDHKFETTLENYNNVSKGQ